MNNYYKLSNGVLIPKIGLGTWQSEPNDCYFAVSEALKVGYRHIDTAYAYHNEKEVGMAIKDSKIKREEIFVTTKLPAEVKGYQNTIDKFYESLSNLSLTYIDLYLIHAPWPWSEQGKDCSKENIESWRAMIDLYNKGLIKAIGVSNFNEKEILNLIDATNFKPHVNQIRYFVGNTQDSITKYCQENDILIEAYSPFATGEVLENNILKEMALKYNTSVSKICLDFCLKNNTLPLPKSIHKERIVDNFNIDIDISDDDMKQLNSLYHIASTRKYRD